MKPVYVVLIAASVYAGYAIFAAESAKKPAAPTKKPSAEKAAAPAATAVPAEEPAMPDPVAVVEGVEIKKAELEQTVAAVLGQSGRSVSDLPPEQRTGAYRMVLDDLIVEKLINKRAADVQVSDEAVDTAFKRATANMGSQEEIKAQIEKAGHSLAGVKKDIRTSLRQQQWVESQIKDRAEVTDADAEEFFKKNPEQFKIPERVRASHILLAVKQDATPEVVAKKEKEAEALAQRVKKGEDFAKVAREVSEDPGAKENGGDLNFFAREQMVPAFSEAAFKLKKDEISDPVRTQYGYHIIKVTDRKEAGEMSLAEAKPRVIAFLQQQKKQAAVEKLIREIREKADVKINLPAAPEAAAPSAADNAPAAPAPATPKSP